MLIAPYEDCRRSQDHIPETAQNLLQAGEYLLSAWSKDASTSCAETQVTCKPGKTSPLHCRSDMSALTNWQAGQAGKLSIIRKDRWRRISLCSACVAVLC